MSTPMEPPPLLPYICVGCGTQQHDPGPECGSCHKPMVIVNNAYLDHIRFNKLDSPYPVKEVK